MSKKRFVAAVLAVIMGLSFHGGATVTVYAQDENVDRTAIKPVPIPEGMQQGIVDYSSIKEISELEEINHEEQKVNECKRSTTEKIDVDLTEVMAEEKTRRLITILIMHT